MKHLSSPTARDRFFSPLKKAIDAGGDLDRTIPRSMRKKIADELEESTLRIKKAEVAKIRSAKGGG